MIPPSDSPFVKNLTLPPSRPAFSLVELMVVLGVVTFLAAVSAGVYQKMTAQGRALREVQAGRRLIAAYLTHAAENNGTYLPGMDFTVGKIWFEPYQRDVTIMHAANRYPFRLAPYLDYELRGSILVNALSTQINTMAKPGTAMHDYVVSAFPTFGINYYFVGGCVSGTPAAPVLTYPGDCTSRSGQTTKPLLVFASGGTTDGVKRVEGFNILTPPRLYAETWSTAEWSEKEDPGLHGNIDARHGGRAVCAFLDGSVRLHRIAELRDMRLWNRRAAEADDPSYTLPME